MLAQLILSPLTFVTVPKLIKRIDFKVIKIALVQQSPNNIFLSAHVLAIRKLSSYKLLATLRYHVVFKKVPIGYRIAYKVVRPVSLHGLHHRLFGLRYKDICM